MLVDIRVGSSLWGTCRFEHVPPVGSFLTLDGVIHIVTAVLFHTDQKVDGVSATIVLRLTVKGEGRVLMGVDQSLSFLPPEVIEWGRLEEAVGRKSEEYLLAGNDPAQTWKEIQILRSRANELLPSMLSAIRQLVAASMK